MKTSHRDRWMWLLLSATALGLLTGGCLPPGCPQDGLPDDPNGDASQDLPPVANCTGNGLPLASLVFPVGATPVPAGPVAFRWQVVDPEARPVRSRLFVGTSPDVFGQTAQATVISDPDELTVSALAQLDAEGTYFWGVEIFDGCATIRRPASGTGQAFEVGPGLAGRTDLAAIQLCPRPNLPAREVTTFSWDALGVVPASTRVFVSRPDVTNPFDDPLFVFDVNPPTATSVTLPPENALTIGQTYSWGLRVVTGEEVLFSGAGQSGVNFTVAANVPPTGTLLDPLNETRLADDATEFVLRWESDAGNCEDALVARVLLEYLGQGSVPTDLVNSPLAFDVPAGGFELNLLSVLALDDLEPGLWAWGVLVDDGTDALLLPADTGSALTHRTFVRDAGPRFTAVPAVDPRQCADNAPPLTGVAFGYDDANGADTVAVRVVFGPSADTVFDAPVAERPFNPASFGQTAVDAFFVVHPGDSGACPQFPQGPGVYGIELDDRVNPPVRATVAVAYTDCDGNLVPDSVDLARGDARDCNENGVLDVCDIAAGTAEDCNANGIPDSCDIQSGTSTDFNENGIPDECERGVLIGASRRFLLDVDPASGAATARSGLPLFGYADLLGLTVDPATGAFYAVEADDNALLRLSRAPREIARIAPLPGPVDALEFDSVAGVLYAVASATDELWRIDPATGAVSVVGPLGIGGVNDLAFDPATQTLYACPFGAAPVLVVDTGTGATNPLPNPPGVGELAALAYDSVSSVLLGADSDNDQLVMIDVSTGVAQPGPAFTFEVATTALLAFEPAADRLWLHDRTLNDTALFAVDRIDGVLTALDGFGFTLDGLALRTATGVLYGIDAAKQLLVALPPARLAPTPVGPLAVGRADVLNSLAYVPVRDALWSLTRAGTDLYEIDPDTAAVTLPFDPVTSELDVRGLTFDAGTGALFGLNGFPSQLLFIDPTSEEFPVVQIGDDLPFFADSLTLDATAGVFWSAAQGSGLLGRISTAGAGEIVTPTLVSAGGLARDATDGTLWAAGEAIYQMVPGAPRARSRNSIGFDIRGMATDPGTGVIYAAGRTGFSDFLLLTIDYAAGEAVTIGSMGRDFVEGLAFDPVSGTMYAIGENSESTQRLFTVDPATGSMQEIADLNLNGIGGLAFDPASGRLLAARELPGPTQPGPHQLLDVNVADGTLTPIGGSVAGRLIAGLAYDWTTGTLYGTDIAQNELVTIDPATGDITPVGPLGHGAVRALTVSFTPQFTPGRGPAHPGESDPFDGANQDAPGQTHPSGGFPSDRR